MNAFQQRKVIEASVKRSEELLTLSFLCFLSFPAFAKHSDYEVYKLVGSVVVSFVVTYISSL